MGMVDKIRDTAEELKDKAESVIGRDHHGNADHAKAPLPDPASTPPAPVEISEVDSQMDEPVAPPEPARPAAPANESRAILAVATEGSVRPPGLAFDVPEGTVMPGVPIGSQWPTNEKRPS